MSPDFYQAHLDQVSRSFALCIRQLPEPLKHQVGLSYLLCRVLDTIEDAAWTDAQAQKYAYNNFDLALSDVENIDPIKTWTDEFPVDITSGERALLMDAAQLIYDFHVLPAKPKDILSNLISAMSRGMQHFGQTKTDGDLRLKNLAEVNQYCFFVAGVVGELLARLVALEEPNFAPTKDRLIGAHHFGQFLQKVNLLKDQVGDEKLGRHLIPSREIVETDARTNAEHAFEFLTAIPPSQTEFRRFCAWSLFLGLESLRVARDSKSKDKVLKVTRTVMQDLLQEIEECLDSKEKLGEIFRRQFAALNWHQDETAESTEPPPAWLTQIYRGHLNAQDLAALRLSN